MLEIAAQSPATTSVRARPRWGLRDHPLLTLMVVGVLGRLVLAFVPGHNDVIVFTGWADELAAHGPIQFYRGEVFRDYLPGYLYMLLVFGELRSIFGISDWLFQLMLKMPALVADIGSALLLYHLLRGLPEKRRMFAVATYLALPPVLFIGVVWGQVDSILAFFLLLTVYYFDRKRPVAAGVAFAVAFIVKPQAAAAAPAFAVWALTHYDRKTIVNAVAAGLIVGVLLIIPFFVQPFAIFPQLITMTNHYNNNAMHSLNFWSMWGWEISDDHHFFLGIDWRTWGTLLTFVAYVPVVLQTRRARTTGELCLGVAVSILVFYTFQTRMHERYSFVAILPMLAGCMLLSHRRLWLGFAAVCALQLMALIYAYGHQFYGVRLTDILDYNPGWHIKASPAVYALSAVASGVTLWLMLQSKAIIGERQSHTPKPIPEVAPTTPR
ncbi:MAG: glycosyltransferase 87 family protein [Chloroflexota bacterium]